MKKLAKLVVGFIALVISVNASAQTYTLHPGIDINLDFKPGVSKTLSNPMFWSMTVSCTLTTEKTQVLMQAKAIKKGASLEGQTLKQGQTKEMIVHNSQVINIKADGSAKIELTNLSDGMLSAKCKV